MLNTKLKKLNVTETNINFIYKKFWKKNYLDSVI